MEYFFIALQAVTVMLLYAVPGFILVKTKAIKSDSISAFAKVLMYGCQPCLMVYSFSRISSTPQILMQMGKFFLLSFVFLCALLGLGLLLIGKKRRDVQYRICVIAVSFSNCAFFGIPLLEALFPENPETITFCSVFFFSMSLLGWTAASAIISLDFKYVSIKKIILNPSVIALLVSLPLFLFNIQLPTILDDSITTFGRLSTPLCMLIMGMRLGVVDLKHLFTRPMHYITVALRQLIVPVLALGIVLLLPFDPMMRVTFVIMTACPVASVVLTFAEMLDAGQETAADLVLLGTMTSVVTIPVITLLLQFVI